MWGVDLPPMVGGVLDATSRSCVVWSSCRYGRVVDRRHVDHRRRRSLIWRGSCRDVGDCSRHVDSAVAGRGGRGGRRLGRGRSDDETVERDGRVENVVENSFAAD